jgi:hypothetical protein
MAEENIVIKIKADVGVSKEVIEAVTKAMEGLGKTATIVSGNVKVTNKNLEDTNKILGQVGQTANNTGKALGNAGNTLKKSNQQWMNLALVVQDLPYGFRGIQNNLPALLGGIAGVGGVAYLAFSAIIAGLTMWDEHNRKVAASTKKVKEEEDAVLKSLSNEAVKVNELIVILENENETRDRKKRALKELQAINPDVFKDLKLEGDKVNNLNTYYNTYIENLKNVILLKKYEKDLEALIQADLKTGQPIKVQQQKSLKKTTDLLNLNNTAVKDNISTAKVSNGKDQNVINSINKYNTAQQQKLDLLDKIKKISPSIALAPGDTGKGGSSKGASYAEKVLEGEIKAKEAELQLFKDDYNQKAKIQLDLLNLQKKYDLLKLKDTKFTEKEKSNIALQIEEEYANKRFLIYEQTNDSIFKSIEESYSNRILLANGNLDEEKVIYQEELYWLNQMLNAKFISQDDYEKKVAILKNKVAIIDKKTQEDLIKNAILFAQKQTSNIETELGVQDKLNKNSLTRRIEDTKTALAKLAVLAAFTFDPKILAIYLDGIDKMTAKLKGLGGAWDQTAKSINTIIIDLVNNSLNLLAESIGKAFAGENVEIFNSFGLLIADALVNVGKSLIEYATLVGIATALFADPLTWPVALAVGVAAVAAGAFLKSKLTKKDKGSVSQFANGGIISGPTMGLMGEYPGAKSNPEVVAPLDKLKGLIGASGGGTLEARISGNDLLILMNKAQRNNNTTF